MLSILWSVPSGSLIAISAFVALIPGLIPPNKLNGKLRAFFLLFTLLLVAGELSVLSHNQQQSATDRQAQDLKHEQEITKLLTHFSTVENLLTTDIRINAMKSRNGASPSTLKNRALDLSDEILQFLVSRQVSPGYGQGGYGSGEFGGIDTSTEAYQKQTVEMFTATFLDRVTAIRDALAEQGLTDKQLDAEYRNPMNAYSIKTIAQQIASLAEKLRQ
jgi:hypothetical protein